MLTLTNTLLALSFILLRTLLGTWLQSQSVWVGYGLESFLCLTFIVINFKKVSFNFHPIKSYLLYLNLSAVLGAVIALVAKKFFLPPFNFTEILLWVELVLVAPLLEEALFRLLLWDVLKQWMKSEKLLVVVTAVLFSLSHLIAYIYVPSEFYGFVFFQSSYTFLLGLHWGYIRVQSKSWTSIVPLHFTLNLFFGLCFLFLT